MNQRGVTLVELMVVVALAAIIGITAMNMFTLSNRTFLDQNRVVDVQREGRLVMDYVAQVLRETGLNPLNSSDFEGVRAGFNLGQITVDRDSDLDGILDDKEVISFKRSPVAGGGFVLERGHNIGGPSTMVWHQVARNIESFGFEYYDATGGVLSGTDPSDIRSIDVILTFKDEKFSGGDIIRSYKRRVDLRNF